MIENEINYPVIRMYAERYAGQLNGIKFKLERHPVGITHIKILQTGTPIVYGDYDTSIPDETTILVAELIRLSPYSDYRPVVILAIEHKGVQIWVDPETLLENDHTHWGYPEIKGKDYPGEKAHQLISNGISCIMTGYHGGDRFLNPMTLSKIGLETMMHVHSNYLHVQKGKLI